MSEGDHVEAGQVLATVADPKIALRIRALDAQIAAAQSRVENARTEFERAEQLRARGVSPQQRVDQAKTAFDVATNDLKAVRSERLVAEQQVEEGQVLAAVLVPFALELVGLLPPSFAFEGGGLLLLPRALELRPTSTTLALLWSNLMFIATPALVLARLRDELSRAERRLAMHALQLRQLLEDRN